MALAPHLNEILSQIGDAARTGDGDEAREAPAEGSSAVGASVRDVLTGLRETLPQVIEVLSDATRDAADAIVEGVGAEPDNTELVEVQPALRDLPQDPVDHLPVETQEPEEETGATAD